MFLTNSDSFLCIFFFFLVSSEFNSWFLIVSLKQALSNLGCNPNEAVMIGDVSILSIVIH